MCGFDSQFWNAEQQEKYHLPLSFITYCTRMSSKAENFLFSHKRTFPQQSAGKPVLAFLYQYFKQLIELSVEGLNFNRIALVFHQTVVSKYVCVQSTQ